MFQDARAREITLVLARVSPCQIKGQKFTFQIVSRDETTMLRAETAEEMDEWIEALQQTCQSLLTDKIEDVNAPLSVRKSTEVTDPVPLGRASSEPEISENSLLTQFILKNNFCIECTRSLAGI